MDDSLYQEIFVSNKTLYLNKGSSYEAEANLMPNITKTAAITLKVPHKQPSQAVTVNCGWHCHEFVCQVLPKQRLLVYLLIYY